MSLLWIALTKVKGLGTRKLANLYKSFPNTSFEFLTDPSNFNHIKNCLKSEEIIELVTNRNYLKKEMTRAEEIVNNHKRLGIEIITIDDKLYPINLKSIQDPPIVLYCKGNIELLKQQKSIAIVGTRTPTDMGTRSAKRLSSVFAEMGYTIVSGLALGIDAAAHIGALRIRGNTIAVLAGGLDKVYPKENETLANEIILNRGLLISETPVGGRTFKNSFVLRDRIQSGLSLGVCPVQTDIVGGTQHTIKFAKQQKRLLFCPEPQEKDVKQNRGIIQLIDNKEVEIVQSYDDYQKIEVLLQEVQESLFREEKDHSENSHPKIKKVRNQGLEAELKLTLDKACKLSTQLNIDIEQLKLLLEEQYFSI
ncbi:DNA-processing protein DprA [Cytobacillus sp. FSL H8-0458]|uniref:DNA-processing protein DprA n=1 Tax=Cytobacillus sp. FSL H8-0458 TaxID=2975346 RepID=UPI0030FA0CBA